MQLGCPLQLVVALCLFLFFTNRIYAVIQRGRTSRSTLLSSQKKETFLEISQKAAKKEKQIPTKI